MHENKKVLIVDDSSILRFEVKQLLQKLKVKLFEAGGELGLFNLIEEYGKPVDLIIMDLNLKETNGFDLIDKIKSTDKYSTIPIIILTELADMQSVLKAKELGVSSYIRKPIPTEDFISKVNELLNN